jgi:integrase
MPKTATATPDEPTPRKRTKKSTPKLRDGVMKRGATWSYVIRVKDPETGVSKPRWVGGFATEDDAKAARDEARVKARRGEYIDRNSITVAEYLDQWLDTHAMEIKPGTLQDYRIGIRLYVNPHIGKMKLQAVRPSTITKLYRDLLAKGGRNGKPLSVATVVHTHAILRRAFRDAVVVEQLLDSSPVERAKRPRARAEEPGTVWTPAQLRTFLAVARRHRLYAFFHVAAYTGARRGELLNLRWSDVDLDDKQITITGSAGVVDGERLEGTTKSGRTRVVSIDDETAAVLREHRRAQASDKLLAGDEWRGEKDCHVFTTGLGEPIYPDTVTALPRKLINAYNHPKEGRPPAEPLPYARLHDLRHIHATTLLLAGVPVHVVAARLGHADPAITLRVYAHVVRSAETAAADVFAKAIKAA